MTAEAQQHSDTVRAIARETGWDLDAPRTIDVPELSTIEPHETLADWRKRTHPRRPRRWWLFTFHAYRN